MLMICDDDENNNRLMNMMNMFFGCVLWMCLDLCFKLCSCSSLFCECSTVAKVNGTPGNPHPTSTRGPRPGALALPGRAAHRCHGEAGGAGPSGSTGEARFHQISTELVSPFIW